MNSKFLLLRKFFNRLRPLRNRWRIFYLRKNGIEINYSSVIEAGVMTRLGWLGGTRGDICILDNSHLSDGVILDCWGGRISIKENVFIGPYTVVYGHGGVEIGKNTLISMHCRILSSNHTVPTQDTLIRSQPDILLATEIGEDVWVGSGVTILGGVKIGRGCVVGAGAVVTKSLPPYSIAVGVPAQVMSTRSIS